MLAASLPYYPKALSTQAKFPGTLRELVPGTAQFVETRFSKRGCCPHEFLLILCDDKCSANHVAVISTSVYKEPECRRLNGVNLLCSQIIPSYQCSANHVAVISTCVYEEPECRRPSGVNLLISQIIPSHQVNRVKMKYGSGYEFDSDEDSEYEGDEKDSEYEEDEKDSEEGDYEEECEEEEGEHLQSEDEADSEDNTRPDEDLRTKIWSALEKLETASPFAFSNVPFALPFPCLHLPQSGEIKLPLSADDALKIITQASRSPFGKKEETLIDTAVRKSWELQPDQFSLKNPAWKKAVKTIINSVCSGLHLCYTAGKVTAELHKLLLYEPGSFFKEHKDSEKVPGMFGTLVVCLPSPHEGGKVVLKHGIETYEYNSSISSSCSFSYAAWYSDITHEVLPITSGYRLVLVYNLVRQDGFELPAYNLTSSRVQDLYTLLEEYKLRLERENEDDKLPPMLVHKLNHMYTKASLKLKSLHPQDFLQVHILSQLSMKLGFDIYLSTLELLVQGSYKYKKWQTRKQTLEKVVELNGKLVVEKFHCPEDTLIDPKPQDSRKPDKFYPCNWTGNSGCDETHWYRDTVVVLVPPSKKLEFIFQFHDEGKVVEIQFLRCLEELSKDSSQKSKLGQLCERALKKDPTDWKLHGSTILPFFQRALDTAFDLDRIDLFDVACETSCDEIILDNPHMLGCWTAKHGVAAISDRLMKGVRKAGQVTKKVEFLKSVEEAFQTAVEESGSAEKATLKKWSDEAILTAVAEIENLKKEDAVCLAQLSKSMDWTLYQSKAMSIILNLKGLTMVKIAFIDEWVLQHEELTAGQRSFLEMILLSIWDKFVFKGEFYHYFCVWRYFQNENDICKKDLLHIVETSVKVLSSDCVEKTIIPAMLTAIPSAEKECVHGFFISLVRMILKNELAGFSSMADDTVPPPLHQRLVLALLTKFLMESIKPEPVTPTDWSLPPCSCNCEDCIIVNRFLEDPVQKVFNLPCMRSRRRHLNQSFIGRCKDRCYNRPTFSIKIIRGSKITQNVWQMSKHRDGYETAKSDWLKSIETAKQALLSLKNDEAMGGRLEAYLQSYYSIVMNLKVKELPDLQVLVATSQILATDKNSVPNVQTNPTGHKRVGSRTDDFEARQAKLGKHQTRL